MLCIISHVLVKSNRILSQQGNFEDAIMYFFFSCPFINAYLLVMLMVIKITNKQKTVSYNQIVPGSESLEITPRFSIKLREKMATDSECQFLSMIPLFYVPQQLKTRQVNFPYFVQCMLKSHSSCSVRPVISLHATAAF